jgi:pimeloyl-ACP methyl ester carboxylesterase
MLDEIHAARSAAAGKERAAASGGGAASPGAGGQGFEPRDKQASQESTTRHQLAVLADPVCYEPGLPLLPRLAAPALLIAGGRDPVTSDELRAAFRAASPANRVLEFPQAGHFAHADDPAGYAAAVTSFLAGSPAEAGRPSP